MWTAKTNIRLKESTKHKLKLKSRKSGVEVIVWIVLSKKYRTLKGKQQKIYIPVFTTGVKLGGVRG